MLSALALSVMISVQTPSPQLYPRIRLEEYLPPIPPSDRSFEEASAFVQRNGEDGLFVTPPQIEMTASEDLPRIWVSLAFNWVWLTDAEGRRPVWFARLRAMSWGGVIERFADSRQCPGVAESLRQLDALPVIEPRVPGLPNPAGPSDMTDMGVLLMHDNNYGIRLRGLSAGGVFSDRLQVNGGSSANFAPVVADSLSRLKPCWIEAPPPDSWAVPMSNAGR